MSIESRRKYPRSQFVKSIRYSVSVLETGELKKIYDIGVSIDIGDGGLGMITGYPLESGHVLLFEYEIKVDSITARASIVRWTRKIDNNRYRVGLEFV